MMDVEVQVPGDKSMTHRVLLLAGLAKGESRVRGLLAAGDTRSTAAALRTLGIAVPELPADGSAIVVRGRGLRGLEPPDGLIDCGNSGTTARLLLGILAAQPFTATLTGDRSLRSRPMRRVTEPLTRMGAIFQELVGPDRLPIQVRGATLRPIDFVSGTASAQVKSAVLLAGVAAGAAVTVREPRLSRDHTERMLSAMGVELERTTATDGSACVRLVPTPMLEPLDMTVPGDFSSAAFFIAFALLGPGGELRLRNVGVNPTRTGFLEVVRRMGAEVLEADGDLDCGEPVADLVVRPATLRATEIEAAEIPALIDEVPVLAVLAARAIGETRIRGAGELRVKESDRLAALAANLRAVGVDVEESADGLVVRGTDAALGGHVVAYDDHRIAMAFGVLGASRDASITIDDPDCADVSYPGFWSELHRVAHALARS